MDEDEDAVMLDEFNNFLFVREVDENTPTSSLIDIQPKPLMQLTIEAVIKVYIERLKKVDWTDVEKEMNFWKDFPNIPSPFVTHVYQALYLASGELSPNIRHAIVIPFLRPEHAHCLTQLNISGFNISCNLLAKILINQAKSLKHLIALNLQDTSIDMFSLCSHLEKLHVDLPAMTNLSINQPFLLFENDDDAGCDDYSADMPDSNELSYLAHLVFGQMDAPADIAHPLIKRDSMDILKFMPNLETFSFESRTVFSFKNEKNLYRRLEARKKLTNLTLYDMSPTTLVNLNAGFGASLTTACFRNMGRMGGIGRIVCDLPNLTHLDISSCREYREIIRYRYPGVELYHIVKNLKFLSYLDISGTNLHMTTVEDVFDPEDFNANKRFDSEIVALSALHQRLDYLGLIDCGNAGLKSVPANNIFSQCTEDQVLLAFDFFTEDRKHMTCVTRCICEFYKIHRNVNRASEIMLKLLQLAPSYMDNGAICRHLSLAMFYLLDKCVLTENSRHVVISTMIDMAERHDLDQLIVRNFAMIMARMNLAGYKRDLASTIDFFAYKYIFCEHFDHAYRRIILACVDSLICEVDEETHSRVDTKQIISVLMYGLKQFHRDWEHEDLWGILWNVTDKSPENVDLLFNIGFLDLVTVILVQLNFSEVITVRILGLLENVCDLPINAEEVYQRPVLFNKIIEILSDENASLELVYNAAAIFRNYWARGFKYWLQQGRAPEWATIHNAMFRQIHRFDMAGVSFVAYRSLSPFFKSLRSLKSQAAQAWAAWCLANNFQTSPELYTNMIGKRGAAILRLVIKAFPKGSMVHRYLDFVLNKMKEVDPEMFQRSRVVANVERMYIVEEVWNDKNNDLHLQYDSEYRRNPCFYYNDKPSRAMQFFLASDHPDLQDLTWQHNR